MSIYNISQIARELLPLAATPNIQFGFRVSRVWPIKRNIFTENGFISSDVTDRPCPGSTSILSLEVGKQQISKQSIAREITSPPSTTIGSSSATCIAAMDVPRSQKPAVSLAPKS